MRVYNQVLMGELIGANPNTSSQNTPLVESALVTIARQKLAILPLQAVREAGIWRDRRFYFLNISYPL